MAMRKCKECNEEISSKAKKCPRCGIDLRSWFMKHKIITFFISCICFFVLIGIIIGANSDSNSASKTALQTISNVQNSDSKITKENYDKITNGMSKSEVISILGEPTSKSESQLEGLGTTEMLHYQLGFSTKAIDVFITNDKVTSKNWTEL